MVYLGPITDEPQAPGSICPVCSSPDIDIENGMGYCANKVCGAKFQFRIRFDIERWNPTAGRNIFWKMGYYTRQRLNKVLAEYKKLWCVHEYRLTTVDSWEEELNYAHGTKDYISMTTLVKDIPPYLVCKHCDKRIQAK